MPGGTYMEPKWLSWARQLQSIAQAWLTYSKDKYDIERFQQIRDLSVEILNEYTGMGNNRIKDLFCNETGYQTPKVDVRVLCLKTTGSCWLRRVLTAAGQSRWMGGSQSGKGEYCKGIKRKAG